MTKNDIKRLYRFLKELGLYRQFIAYTDKNINFHHKNSFAEYCKTGHIDTIISGAFLWIGTPQGDPFWRRISRCWQLGGVITDFLREELKEIDLSKTFK